MDIWERFPDMKPLARPPRLNMIEGIGTTVYGRRDHDPETGTYVKTQCFVVFFVPLFFLAAYRVADAPGGGWYFLGKVALSGLTKAWNLLVLLLALFGAGLGWWAHYTDSPEYRARQELAAADDLRAAGQIVPAAEKYRALLHGPEHVAAEQHLSELLAAPPDNATEAAKLFRIGVDLHQRRLVLSPELYARAKKYAEDHADADLAGALSVLDAVQSLAPSAAAHATTMKPLLERRLAKDPNDLTAAAGLAKIAHATGDIARAEALLMPHFNKLGQHEGAALLGHILLEKGNYEKAIIVLEPFVDAHQGQLTAEQSAAQATIQAAQQKLLMSLQNGTAPGFDFPAYHQAPPAKQQEMVLSYVAEQVREDPQVAQAQAILQSQETAVQAMFELGVALLRLAQTRIEGGSRRGDLEKAEKIFVALASTHNDEVFKVRLGQIYYWLDKPQQARAEFDKLLQANGRQPTMLLQVAEALREVGAESEARALTEEAHNKSTDQHVKSQAAHARATLAKDLDDRILWLERASKDDAEAQAYLTKSRAEKAHRDGDNDRAVQLYRETVAMYARFPESAEWLNNGAVALLGLYQITLDRKDFDKAIAKLERAVALKPNHSLLLGNTATFLLDRALLDIAGPQVDWATLKRGPGMDVLSMLYHDKATRQAVVEKLDKHPDVAKARSYWEKLLVLAPKRPDAYSSLEALHGLTRNTAALRRVVERLQANDVDIAESTRKLLDAYSGKDDKKNLEQLQKALARFKEVLGPARKVGGVTFALAVQSYVVTQVGLAMYQGKVDADELVRLAEEAHVAAPSTGTQGALKTALQFRAHQSLTKARPEYAALAERTQRSLGLALVTWALGHEGPLRAKAVANADVRRLQGLDLEELKTTPDELASGAWAVLLPSYPEEAAALARRLENDPVAEARLVSAQVLAPLSADTVLQRHWTLLMQGKTAEAWDVVTQAAAKGTPLPGK
jgi:tetratricopeptide (TPR) repeat protein